jgi:hypothetical protein
MVRVLFRNSQEPREPKGRFLLQLYRAPHAIPTRDVAAPRDLELVKRKERKKLPPL